MSLLDMLPASEGFKRRRRADAVAASRAILSAATQGRPPVLPVIKAVDLAVRARYPGVADSDDIVRLISAFADPSPTWTLVQAAEAGLWSLVQRITVRDRFDAVDPSYRQWVYTKALASAAASGRLDMVQFLAAHFPGCYVTLAVEEAASHGHLPILQWLRQHHDSVKWGANELALALRCNHAEVAHFLYDHVPPSRSRGDMKGSAVDSGNLELVQWAFANDQSTPEPQLLQHAVSRGSLEIVQWLVESGHVPLDGTDGIWLDTAASEGHLDLIKWATSRGIGRCSHGCVERAGANGHLEVVKWILEHRCDGRGEDPMDEIAGNGNLEIVRWIVDKRPESFSSSAMDMAARHGHLDVVVFLHECEHFDFKCSSSAMNGAAENGHLDIVKWLHEHRMEGCTSSAMDGAAMNGHLDVVKWLHENRSEGCTIWAMNYAAMNGHLDVVKWLHEHRQEGCTINAMSLATGKGHLSVVKWFHENRREGLTSYSIVSASRNGHLDVLKWLHENRKLKPSNEVLGTAIDVAAGNGLLCTTRWLAATYGMQCSPTAMDKAARNGLFDMMLVLQQELGCTCSDDTFASAFKSNELEIVQWMCRRQPDRVDHSRFTYESFGCSPYILHWLFIDDGLLPELPRH